MRVISKALMHLSMHFLLPVTIGEAGKVVARKGKLSVHDATSKSCNAEGSLPPEAMQGAERGKLTPEGSISNDVETISKNSDTKPILEDSTSLHVDSNSE
eukprot:gnl/MRDRNA2_/MRDRNA2_71924_c0_seq2.p1 gnl/MRDRNA2_/MRDRNA2_71924_c0~~gnl/MRDRNA2_/MRDRNA2_71924_c0_seq2.p1  ORF type:complete len:100 (+),score=16.56 gnl/MRDRNA2_/MRDRNA2_71924_c0_seq2:95-394(+)